MQHAQQLTLRLNLVRQTYANLCDMHIYIYIYIYIHIFNYIYIYIDIYLSHC